MAPLFWTGTSRTGDKGLLCPTITRTEDKGFFCSIIMRTYDKGLLCAPPSMTTMGLLCRNDHDMRQGLAMSHQGWSLRACYYYCSLQLYFTNFKNYAAAGRYFLQHYLHIFPYNKFCCCCIKTKTAAWSNNNLLCPNVILIPKGLGMPHPGWPLGLSMPQRHHDIRQWLAMPNYQLDRR